MLHAGSDMPTWLHGTSLELQYMLKAATVQQTESTDDIG